MEKNIKVLVKIVLHLVTLNRNKDPILSIESRNVKLMLEKEAKMSDMVKVALIHADLYDQYRCTDVTYYDQEFNEDVYVNPNNQVKSHAKYKMTVTKIKTNVIMYF